MFFFMTLTHFDGNDPARRPVGDTSLDPHEDPQTYLNKFFFYRYCIHIHQATHCVLIFFARFIQFLLSVTSRVFFPPSTNHI